MWIYKTWVTNNGSKLVPFRCGHLSFFEIDRQIHWFSAASCDADFVLLFCRRPVATPAEVGAEAGAFFLQGFIIGGRTLSLSSPAAAASCKGRGKLNGRVTTAEQSSWTSWWWWSYSHMLFVIIILLIGFTWLNSSSRGIGPYRRWCHHGEMAKSSSNKAFPRAIRA